MSFISMTMILRNTGAREGLAGKTGRKQVISKFPDDKKTFAFFPSSRQKPFAPIPLCCEKNTEIVNTSVDLSVDYSELFLDDFLADGILKEIPIIKSIYAVGKIGFSIKERFFVKKLLFFLQEYHNQNITQQKLNEFKAEFNSDEKYRNKVTEQIMIFTDSFLTVDKAKILAKLFKSHIDGNFDWPYFLHLSTCLNSIHPKTFPFLQQLSNHNFKISEEPTQRGIPRDGENEALLYSTGIAYETCTWSSGLMFRSLEKICTILALNN